MNSTNIVSILETNVEALKIERQLLADDLARSRTTVRQMLLDAKIAGINKQIKHLEKRIEDYE